MTSLSHRTMSFVRRFAGLCALLAFATTLLPPTSALARPAGAPEVWLPTPVGETWHVIQGYFCGTHWEGHEIDFARVHGSTVGAPVRAAANGVVHFWTPSSGTLIVSHGNHYYTEYTHMSHAYVTRPGSRIYQGQEIGRINGYAHLHFSLYYSPSGSYFGRRTVPLHFVDGYSFPEQSGCNQHYGRRFVARDNPDTDPPGVEFTSAARPNRWYRDDQRIEFRIRDDRQVRGFSQALNDEPGGEAPDFQTETGYMQLSWGGEGYHTIRVRAWDVYGHQTVASFGPIGYDAAPPTFALPASVPERVYTPDAGGSVYLAWEPASDGNGSGVAGYAYYLGSDPNGTSNNISDYHGAGFADLYPGCYVLRVQAVDHADWRSEWVTMERVVITDPSGEEPSCTSLSAPAETSTPLPATETSTPLPAADAGEVSTPTPAPETSTPTPLTEETARVVVGGGKGTETASPTVEPTMTATPAGTEPSPTSEPTTATPVSPTQEAEPVRLVPIELSPVAQPGDPSPTPEPTDTPTPLPVPETPTAAPVLEPSPTPDPSPTREAEPVRLVPIELSPVAQPAPPTNPTQDAGEGVEPSPTMQPNVQLVPVVVGQ